MFDEIDGPLRNPDTTSETDKITEESESDKIQEETPQSSAFMTQQTLAMFFWGLASLQGKGLNKH